MVTNVQKVLTSLNHKVQLHTRIKTGKNTFYDSNCSRHIRRKVLNEELTGISLSWCKTHPDENGVVSSESINEVIGHKGFTPRAGRRKREVLKC